MRLAFRGCLVAQHLEREHSWVVALPQRNDFETVAGRAPLAVNRRLLECEDLELVVDDAIPTLNR
jgi:hypothetical protein